MGETTIRQPRVCTTSNIGGKSATSRQDWLRQFCPLALAEQRATMTVVHRVTAAELLQCAYFDPLYGFKKLATVDGTPAHSCPQRYMCCKMR
jgi:hypothetical protein